MAGCVLNDPLSLELYKRKLEREVDFLVRSFELTTAHLSRLREEIASVNSSIEWCEMKRKELANVSSK